MYQVRVFDSLEGLENSLLIFQPFNLSIWKYRTSNTQCRITKNGTCQAEHLSNLSYEDEANKPSAPIRVTATMQPRQVIFQFFKSVNFTAINQTLSDKPHISSFLSREAHLSCGLRNSRFPPIVWITRLKSPPN